MPSPSATILPAAATRQPRARPRALRSAESGIPAEAARNDGDREGRIPGGRDLDAGAQDILQGHYAPVRNSALTRAPQKRKQAPGPASRLLRGGMTNTGAEGSRPPVLAADPGPAPSGAEHGDRTAMARNCGRASRPRSRYHRNTCADEPTNAEQSVHRGHHGPVAVGSPWQRRRHFAGRYRRCRRPRPKMSRTRCSRLRHCCVAEMIMNGSPSARSAVEPRDHP